tara:strand:- start:133 stop:471 length:339 start_codon:yes stop_codon:yes gene_type:complete
MSLEKVAELNDFVRNNLYQVGLTKNKLLLTSGVSALGEERVNAILEKVKNFNDFSEDNNPYGEKDFGSINNEGTKIYWKIDYYDNEMKYHSEDKSDPNKTVRVLTVMKSSEY